MQLSIIIVSWNVKDDLLACLSSLKNNPPLCVYETIVVDNNSSDETVPSVKQNFPEVKVIANADNKGFAAANNQGIEISNGQYVLLLNPDTVVHPGSLDKIVKVLDNNPDVGACSGILLNADGSIQRSLRRFPTFRGVLYCHTVCRLLCLFKGHYRQWLMKDFKYDKQIDVEQIMGAEMLIRKSVLNEVGYMDENFFMYFEEVDLCYRIKQAGWRILFIPDAPITHLAGKSSRQLPMKRILLFKSMLKYFKKHRGKLATGSFSILFKITLILRNFCHLFIGIVGYLLAIAIHDKRRIQKAKDRIILHSLLMTKYLWHIITL